MKKNQAYIYKYSYVIIIFLVGLVLTFALASFQNTYFAAVEKYNNAVSFGVWEEFSPATRNTILGLQANVELAKQNMQYNTLFAFLLSVIFLALGNYFYVILGVKKNFTTDSPSKKLLKHIFLTISIVEIVCFVTLIIFGTKEYIGLNFWTLFYVNIMLAIIVVVVSLQIQYWLKPKQVEEVS